MVKHLGYCGQLSTNESMTPLRTILRKLFARPYCAPYVSLVKRLCLVILMLAMICPNARAGTVTLAWTPSTASDAASYVVFTGTTPTNLTPNVTVSATYTNATVSNLVDGVAYYFAAATVNTAGVTSVLSSTVSWVIPTNVPPSVTTPASVVCTTNGNYSIALTGIGDSVAGRTLTVGAFTTNTQVLTNVLVAYTSPASTGVLSWRAISDGRAPLNVWVYDGVMTNIVTFTVTVLPASPTGLQILTATP